MSDERHEWSDGVCRLLSDITQGRAASLLMDSVPSEGAALFVLPVWSWRRAKMDVGRKQRDDSGRIRLLPIPVDWQDGPVHLVRDESKVVSYAVRGLGHDESGSTRLNPSGLTPMLTYDPRERTETGLRVPILDPATMAVDGEYDVPTAVTSVVEGSTKIREVLHELQLTGEHSLWLFRRKVEPRVRRALEAANFIVAREVFGPEGRRTVLDNEQLESLQTAFMLGEGDVEYLTPTGATRRRQQRPAMDRIIERLLTKVDFTKVDINLYMRRAIMVEAETAVRGAIGDPHIGRKVRALAATKPFATVSELIDEYNRIYPRDHLSIQRATAALIVTHHTDPHTLSLVDRNGIEHDHSDPEAQFEERLIGEMQAEETLSALCSKSSELAERLSENPLLAEILVGRLAAQPEVADTLLVDPSAVEHICENEYPNAGPMLGESLSDMVAS